MIDTGQFRFKLEVYECKDEEFEKQVANRRFIRSLGIAAPLVVVGLFITTLVLTG